MLYEAIDVPTSDSLYLVLEFMSGGTVMDIKLGDTTTPLPTEVAREYFRQLVLGLEYLHENDVAHRDVRPLSIQLSAPLRVYLLINALLPHVDQAGQRSPLRGPKDRQILRLWRLGDVPRRRRQDEKERRKPSVYEPRSGCL